MSSLDKGGGVEGGAGEGGEAGGSGGRKQNLLRSFQKKGCPNLAVRAWKITVTCVCVRGGKREYKKAVCHESYQYLRMCV